MRITVGQLRQIIKEEVSRVNKRRRLYEFGEAPPPPPPPPTPPAQSQNVKANDDALNNAPEWVKKIFEEGQKGWLTDEKIKILRKYGIEVPDSALGINPREFGAGSKRS
jgi:hypothetical protein